MITSRTPLGVPQHNQVIKGCLSSIIGEHNPTRPFLAWRRVYTFYGYVLKKIKLNPKGSTLPDKMIFQQKTQVNLKNSFNNNISKHWI